MSYSRSERLAEFLARLASAPLSSTAAEAFALVVETLDAVEDEMSGMPNQPEQWALDRRLYPPRMDNAHALPGVPGVMRYRTRGHNIFIADNGAIEVRRGMEPSHHGELLLRKPGTDGRELDTYYFPV